MRIPVHALRLAQPVPSSPSLPDRLQQALDGPIVRKEAVLDAIGEPYAFDLVLQDGGFLLLAVMVVWGVVRQRVL